MAASKNQFGSTPFRFIVEGQDFYVHADFLTELSPTFSQDVNVGTKEVNQGCVLVGVDAATFQRFVEWVYTGSYTVPPARKLNRDYTGVDADTQLIKSENVVHCPCCFQQNPHKAYVYYTCNHCHYKSSSMKELSHTRSALKQAFLNEKPVLCYHSVVTPPPKCTGDATTSYKNILLCHAQLYVFAESKGIKQLKAHALYETHSWLASLALHPAQSDDIVSLVRYIYDNTVQSKEEELEPMRKLLTRYIAVELDTLVTNGRLLRLAFDLGVENGKDFLNDITSIIKQRL